MRILYIHQHFSTPNGSTGIRSYQMARRLVARGHSVMMVCGGEFRGSTGLTGDFVGGRREGTVDGIDVIEFDLAYSNNDGFLKRSATFLRYAGRSARVALSREFDLVFATSTPLTTGLAGILARTFRRKHFVFEVRDLWPELPKAMGVINNPLALWAMSALEWVSYHAADRLIALSPGIADGIAGRGIDRARIAMIPNGCDLDIFSSDTGPWRPKGVLSSDLMVTFAGAHGLANGLDAVLDAATELQVRSRADIKIVFVGSGRLKEHLQRRAQETRLTNVTFLDSVPKDRLAGLLKASDLGLQILADVPAFYYGTSPNKFFDYLASGLPVLVNYPGWVADLISANNCGYVVSPRNPKAFADALIHAADHRGVLPTQATNARRLAREQFDRDILGDRFIDWIEEAARC